MSKAQTPANEAESVALSTRFTAKQREALEQAAGILNCAPAKLIREAALQRSADVINASGRSGATLRALAEKTLEPLINPHVELRWSSTTSDQPDDVSRMRLAAWNAMPEGHKEGLYQEQDKYGYDQLQVTPIKPDSNDIAQIRAALKTCPTEFARMLLEIWESVETGGQDYQPTIIPSELLGGEDE